MQTTRKAAIDPTCALVIGLGLAALFLTLFVLIGYQPR